VVIFVENQIGVLRDRARRDQIGLVEAGARLLAALARRSGAARGVNRLKGSGFRVQGSGLSVQGSGFRVKGSRFRA
jgi:hypothetical protein